MKINTKWSYCFSLIVNKISMINLKLLISIGQKLKKAKEINLYLTSIFGRLFLIVLIGNFYQFALVQGKTF